MRFARIALIVACVAVGVLSSRTEACGTPPPPPDLPCIGFVNNSLTLQLGTLFQTQTQSQCASAIGLLAPPPGVEFTQAVVGIQNTSTNAFTPIFGLNRLPAADSAWASGLDIHGNGPLPGATWFGFTNLSVPPVTPPPLGPSELFAIQFQLATPLPPGLSGLAVQYGAGLALPTGLPDFNSVGHPEHSAQYSAITVVPRLGETSWVPEPATHFSILLGLGILYCGRRARPLLLRPRGPQG